LSIQQFIQSVVERLQTTASVKTVFGEPIEVKGRTLIPVARVAYGFGVGSGPGKQASGESKETRTGGAGGIGVRPAGVLEITQEGTRFIPIGHRRRLIGALFLGLVLGIMIAGRRSRD
jgi:uncharacterized spore protein YtfJ